MARPPRRARTHAHPRGAPNTLDPRNSRGGLCPRQASHARCGSGPGGGAALIAPRSNQQKHAPALLRRAPRPPPLLYTRATRTAPPRAAHGSGCSPPRASGLHASPLLPLLVRRQRFVSCTARHGGHTQLAHQGLALRGTRSTARRKHPAGPARKGRRLAGTLHPTRTKAWGSGGQAKSKAMRPRGLRAARFCEQGRPHCADAPVMHCCAASWGARGARGARPVSICK